MEPKTFSNAAFVSIATVTRRAGMTVPRNESMIRSRLSMSSEKV
jgi:hypothetical protein